MATKADVLLLKHPGIGELTVPKTQEKLAQQLEAAGLAHCRFTRAGALKLTLTSAGLARLQDLQLASINRGRPATPAPPPTAPRPAPRAVAPRAVAPRAAAPRAAATRPAPSTAPAPRKAAPRKAAATGPSPRKPGKPAARPAPRKPAGRAAPRLAPPPAVPVIPSPRKPLPPTKRVPSLDDLFGEGAFHPEAAEQRPATVADLRALEQRLLARLDQLVAEIASRTPRV